VTDPKIGTVSWSKVTSVPASFPPSGAAGGDLAGSYPDPDLKADAVTSAKILDGTISGADIANATIGTANLDFTPITRPFTPGVSSAEIADNAVSTIKLQDGSVTDPKISTVSWSKITSAPASFPPSGAAGGDLAGSYPNPELKSDAVTSAKILDGTIALSDLGVNGATANQVIKRNTANTAWIVAADDGAVGEFLPLAGGTMTGAITNTGNPPITMGKGNFGTGNVNTGTEAFVAGFNNRALGNYSVVRSIQHGKR